MRGKWKKIRKNSRWKEKKRGCNQKEEDSLRQAEFCREVEESIQRSIEAKKEESKTEPMYVF